MNGREKSAGFEVAGGELAGWLAGWAMKGPHQEGSGHLAAESCRLRTLTPAGRPAAHCTLYSAQCCSRKLDSLQFDSPFFASNDNCPPPAKVAAVESLGDFVILAQASTSSAWPNRSATLDGPRGEIWPEQARESDWKRWQSLSSIGGGT